MKQWRQAIALKKIWWQHCWTFHWAHKPDCTVYRGETSRLGRLRLCRGCTMLYGGVLLGVLPAFLGSGHFSGRAQASIFLMTLAITLASAPKLYMSFPRWSRDSLRLSAGMAIGLWTAQLLHGYWLIPLAALFLMAAGAYSYRGSRLEHRQQICTACPESQKEGICSGYQHQAECIRRYEEEATVWVEARESSRFDRQFF